MMNEDVWQWIGISVSALSVIISIIYSAKSVRAARIESELNAFFTNSGRFHELLFPILSEDPDALKKTGKNLSKPAKFRIYQLIELFSELYDMQEFQKELGDKMWQRWERKINHLMKKDAFRFAWKNQEKDHKDLYSEQFIKHVDVLLKPETECDIAA